MNANKLTGQIISLGTRYDYIVYIIKNGVKHYNTDYVGFKTSSSFDEIETNADIELVKV